MAFTVMQGKISKGNSTGTGWLTLHSHLRGTVSPSKWYDLILSFPSLDYLLLTRKLTKYKNIEGFYIPKALCSTHSLIGQVVSVSLRPTSYFVSRISKDKRVRFPNSVVEEFSIQKNDLFEVEIKTRDKFVREIVLVKTIDNSNRVNCASEFYFNVRMQDIPTSIEAKIKILREIQRVFPKEKKVTEDEILKLLSMNYIITNVWNQENFWKNTVLNIVFLDNCDVSAFPYAKATASYSDSY